MKLIEYIKGDKRGKTANKIERMAQEDPFLDDAIEGYQSVYGNHFDRLNALEQHIEKRAKKKGGKIASRSIVWWSAGGFAAALIVAGMFYFVPFERFPIEEQQMLAMTDIIVNEHQANSEEEIMALYYDGSINRISAAEGSYIIDGNVATEESSAVFDPRDTEVLADSYIAPKVEDEVSNKDAIKSRDAVQIPVGEAVAQAVETKEQRVVVAEELQATQEVAESVQAADILEQAKSTEISAVDNEAITSRAVSQSSMIGEDGLVYIRNEEFERYFRKVRKTTADDEGNPLAGKEIIAEFRVNSYGVPSGIKIISSPSRDLNTELINTLIEYGGWESTKARIRTRIAL